MPIKEGRVRLHYSRDITEQENRVMAIFLLDTGKNGLEAEGFYHPHLPVTPEMGITILTT